MAFDRQAAEVPSVMTEDDVAYILASVLWPRVRWANTRHDRLVALSLRLRVVTLVFVGLAVAVAALGARWWPGPAVVGGAAALTGFFIDRLAVRSDACLESFAYVELWLYRVLTTVPMAIRDRADLLDYCDQNIDDVLYYSSGLFDRRLPASARTASHRTVARELAIDDWRPRPWPRPATVPFAT